MRVTRRAACAAMHEWSLPAATYVTGRTWILNGTTVTNSEKLVKLRKT